MAVPGPGAAPRGHQPDGAVPGAPGPGQGGGRRAPGRAAAHHRRHGRGSGPAPGPAGLHRPKRHVRQGGAAGGPHPEAHPQVPHHLLPQRGGPGAGKGKGAGHTGAVHQRLRRGSCLAGAHRDRPEPFGLWGVPAAVPQPGPGAGTHRRRERRAQLPVRPPGGQMVLRPPEGGGRAGPADELHPEKGRRPGRPEGHPPLRHGGLAEGRVHLGAGPVPALCPPGTAGVPVGRPGGGVLHPGAQRGRLRLSAGSHPAGGAARRPIPAVRHRRGEFHHLGDGHPPGLWGAAPVQPGAVQRPPVPGGPGAIPVRDRQAPLPQPWPALRAAAGGRVLPLSRSGGGHPLPHRPHRRPRGETGHRGTERRGQDHPDEAVLRPAGPHRGTGAPQRGGHPGLQPPGLLPAVLHGIPGFLRI